MDEFLAQAWAIAGELKQEADRIAAKLQLLRSQILDLECDHSNVSAQHKALMNYLHAREGEAAHEANMTATQIVDRRGM